MREILHTLPAAFQEAIRDDLEGTHKNQAHESGHIASRMRTHEDAATTQSIPMMNPAGVA